MLPNSLNLPSFLITGICWALCASVGAQIYSEDFESFTAPAGNFNGGPSGQVGTGLDLAHSGGLTGWSKSGAGTVHIVDSANLWSAAGPGNARNFAVMLWQDNVITQQAGITGSNDSGTGYLVDFLAAPTVYEAPSQKTGAGDGIRIEVLRASDNTVLHNFVHQPGAFVGTPGNLGLSLGSFSYTGDGSGDIKFRIGPSAFNSGRFGGAIDDLQLSVATPIFEGYTINPAVYVAGHAIAANEPLNDVGSVADGFTIAPPLPAGLTLNPTTGIITGTPNAASPGTDYTVTASFPVGQNQAVMLDLTVLASSTLTGYSTSPASYFAGVSITPNTPQGLGGTPDSYAVSPPLPTGLLLDPLTGVITGMPSSVTAAADYTITASFLGKPDSIFLLNIEVVELPSTLIISEFMASNDTTLNDGDGNSSDWIEIHNFGAAAVNLGGWHLTDRSDNLDKWQFPSVVVPAGGYLLVFASNQNEDDYIDAGGFLHTNFSLSAGGEFLGLVQPDGLTVVRSFAPEFPPQVTNISYGLARNLVTIGFFTSPTPGTANPATPSTLGPLISKVTDSPQPNPGDSDDLVIFAQVDALANPVATVTLHYRVMFGAEQAVPMNDLGNRQFSATIPHAASLPGEMVRWYITAEDSASVSRREPAFLDSANSPEYFGTMVDDPAVVSALPTLFWFVASPGAANTGSGTRSSVSFDGQFYDNVFTRRRGASSAGVAKKSYKFDFNSGHHFRFDPAAPRVSEINVNSTFQDKAYIRPQLSYESYTAAGVAASHADTWRVEQNGAFFSVASFVEQVDDDLLDRRGLDPEGALYKMFNGVTSSSSGVEKKTRQHENNSDLQALVSGVSPSNPNRAEYLFDHVDIPAMINYATAGIISQDFDRWAKNFYVYRDTNGSGEWSQIPWDKDLTFGNRFYDDEISGDGFSFESGIPATRRRAHPFQGAAAHACCGVANLMIDILVTNPRTREMYLRRLRTLMDEQLQPLGTPTGELLFETRIDELAAAIAPDAALDLAEWGAIYGGVRDFPTAVTLLKTNYLDERRAYLYEQHGLGSAGDGIASTLVSGVPGAAVARYFVPADDGLGLSWTAKDFGDADWPSGATAFGFETSPSTYDSLIETAIRPADTHPSSTSIFLRIPFDIVDLATVDALQLRMKYDDGFVAYLNGTEVARRNAGGTAGTLVGFDHEATSHPDAQALVFEDIDVSAFSGALVQGENVLAIHALNSSALNSDMLILPELVEAPQPASADSVGIPSAQPGGLQLTIGSLEFNPASGDQNEEYVEITNPNSFAVDVSGWTVEGAIEHTFKPGTVIPAAATGLPLYLSPDVNAFRARATGPTGDEENFVQGRYQGQLSARGEAITIRNKNGNIVTTASYGGSPTDLQQSLRITELNYHPTDPSAAEIAAGFGNDDFFEFVELKNIGPATIDLSGARFVDGIDFVFPASTFLASGAHLLVVSDAAAFALRYPGVSPALVAGQYTGRLSNDGETVQLYDAVGENILKFTYNDRWFPATDGSGYALVVDDETAHWNDWDGALGWGIGGDADGSPGAQNSAVILQQYAGWLNQHFTEAEIGDPLISGPDVDANVDGYSNFYHYAFGTDPRATGGVAEALTSIAFNGVSLEFTYRFRNPALDLEFIVEKSSDLRSWTDATTEHIGSESDGEITTITVRIPAPEAGVPIRRFARVAARPKSL